MSDAFWNAMFIALPIIVGQIIVAYVQLRKADQVAEKTIDTAAGKDSVAAGRLETIHTLVNNRLTEEVEGRVAAEKRVKELELQLSGGRNV